jgi:hypothetical protein
MADDPMASVLRLVAAGRLTAAEAGPLLDALDASAGPGGSTTDGPPPRTGQPSAGGPGRAIRIEITDGGRKVVNLRVPLSLGRSALERVPGLSLATTDRIREAIESGLTGPILEVDDGPGDGVRITIE